MPQYQINSGLPSLPAGLPDKEAGLVIPLYRAINSLAQSISTVSGNVQFNETELAGLDQLGRLTVSNSQTITVKAAEALDFGSLLSLSIDAGKIVAHKADATILTRPAHAICNKVGGIPLNGFGDAIFMQGKVSSIAGTTFGAVYYLSTAGQVQLAAPVATGVINQVIGYGLGSAGFYLDIEPAAKRPVLVYKFNATTLRVLYADGTFTDNAV
jgi:hypothetical protein